MAETTRSMFARIAKSYDRTNAVLSFGVHRRWRRKTVELAQAPRGGSVLDVATGTGELAFQFCQSVGKKGRVVGVDFCLPMLEQARQKAERSGLRVDFQEGDALNLAFPDASFDVASIGFGIRNVDDPRRCLEELARVVRPGGRVVVLEFGQPRGIRKGPYWIYGHLVLPLLGGLLTGHIQPYRYLTRSAERFPSGDRFLDLVASTRRFAHSQALSLSGGVAYAYVAVVASEPELQTGAKKKSQQSSKGLLEAVR